MADVELPRVEFKVWRDETYAYASIADNGKPLTDEQFALRIERLEPCGICCTVRLPLDLSEDEAQNQ